MRGQWWWCDLPAAAGASAGASPSAAGAGAAPSSAAGAAAAMLDVRESLVGAAESLVLELEKRPMKMRVVAVNISVFLQSKAQRTMGTEVSSHPYQYHYCLYSRG